MDSVSEVKDLEDLDMTAAVDNDQEVEQRELARTMQQKENDLFYGWNGRRAAVEGRSGYKATVEKADL